MTFHKTITTRGVPMDSSLFSENIVTSKRIIYTPSSFARTNLIHLQEIGELQAIQPHMSQRENLSSYLFFLVFNGTGILEYNNTSYDLKKGDCVFLDCRKGYYHRTSENLWSLTWVHFYGPNMNGIYEKYIERGGTPYLHPENSDKYRHILSRIYDIADSSNYIKDMKIYEQLVSLLTLLMDESWNSERGTHSAAGKRNLQDIKEYLDQHYQDKITLKHLSDTFFINKFYLTRVFKEQFGISITNYLLQIRITHAKQMLRFTDFPIEKISHECGITDANYFSRVFKKIEGISPGEFRKMW